MKHEIYLIEQSDEWDDMDVWLPIKVYIRDSEAGSALIPRSKYRKTCLNAALSESSKVEMIKFSSNW